MKPLTLRQLPCPAKAGHGAYTRPLAAMRKQTKQIKIKFMLRVKLLTVILLIGFLNYNLSAQNSLKNRVIVLTDIEADPDDTQSLIRLLLYSNQIDIKGLIATTSCWHTNLVNPESIVKGIKAYGKIQPNLLNHEEDFPEEEELLSLVSSGLPKYGMTGVGDGMDSEGSEWIIKELEKPIFAAPLSINSSKPKSSNKEHINS